MEIAYFSFEADTNTKIHKFELVFVAFRRIHFLSHAVLAHESETC